MPGRFSDWAQSVRLTAEEEARRLDHDYIAPAHLLLGLLRDRDEVAARALRTLGVDPEVLAREVTTLAGHGQCPPAGYIPFTPAAKRVLELAVREVLRMGWHSARDRIGTGHLLLGLIRADDALCGPVFRQYGLDADRVTYEVTQRDRR